ncbi:MAG TPA: AI-2E family transporter [Planctomycetota bacterium]|nr:AI-2E family transporter [Planctomycetota bacterium]
MAQKRRNPDISARAISLAAFAIVIAALYLAKDFLIPLALAILFSFLLTPIVKRLEHWGLPRVLSVLTVTFFAFALLVGAGWIVTQQMVDLATRLPEYEKNLTAKVQTLRGTSRTLGKATETLQAISKEITESQGDTRNQPVQPGATSAAEPVPVKVVAPPPSPLTLLWNAIGALLGPLGTVAAVAILVVFILLEREGLRDRFLRLVGKGRLHVTTDALDDASHRVSRYLLMQFVVNATYGIPVGVGLYLIGVPNAFMWGLLATVLRYLPYLGPWMAAAMPILLSFTGEGWSQPLYTIGLFLVLELISNNVMEPWLYGASTGITSVAVLLAAGFWTWLWGLPGLLLSTPLTVLLVVMGKHLPQMSIFSILLGDEEPLQPKTAFYQRLLAGDMEEAAELLKTNLEKKPLNVVYDEIVLPVLRMIELDFYRRRIDENKRRRLEGMVEEIVEQISRPEGESPVAQVEPAPDGQTAVLCVAARDEADGVAARMMTQLLKNEGVNVRALSSDALASELIDRVEEHNARVVCISALPPAALSHARYLCKRLRERYPALRLIIGLWTARTNLERLKERVSCAPTDKTVASLTDALREVRSSLATEEPVRDQPKSPRII